jgi:malonyl-CoA decarboxylase
VRDSSVGECNLIVDDNTPGILMAPLDGQSGYAPAVAAAGDVTGNSMPSEVKPSWKASDFLHGLIDTLAQRGRVALGKKPERETLDQLDLITLSEALLSRRGEASGTVLAQTLLNSFEGSSQAEKLSFLRALAERFGPDRSAIDRAIVAYGQSESEDRTSLEALHSAAEPRRQELFRRLNLAPGGTALLIGMRGLLLRLLPEHPELRAVDRDFAHLFSSWFNRGFLLLRPIDWKTPANVLEKIIKYEAVHAIQGWDDLRNRLEPSDRRCYAFFHPQLPDEPLIFVEVALTKEIPAAIGPLLDKSRCVADLREANTAVFYSISNTQTGLAGISFGNFLIKQVVQDLARELSNLKAFVTLSPVPGFANWVHRELKAKASLALDDGTRKMLLAAESSGDFRAARPAIIALAAYYFLQAKLPSGKAVDPVARFHLGNGARLERFNFLGDPSAKGMKQSFGLMVNYLYDLDQIEANHEAFAEDGAVIASASIKAALQAIENQLVGRCDM